MIFRIASGVFAALFFYSASLQLNDPDPFGWVAAYAVPGLIAAALALGLPVPWPVPALVALAALTGAVAIGRGAVGKIPLSRMFESWAMKDELVERNREAFGLLIVAVWMGTSALAVR